MTPSIVWPCRSAARYAKVGMPASIFLSDAQDLLDRGLTRLRLGPPILAERDHAPLHRGMPDLGGGRLFQDEAPDLLADQEELVDADPALVPRLAAGVASLAPEQLGGASVRYTDGEEVGGVRHVRHPAVLADAPDEPLREDTAEDGRQQIGLDAHVLEPGDRPRRVVGVERGEHEVAGEGGMDGDLRGLEVADLADHD